jgi:hypothetical protein
MVILKKGFLFLVLIFFSAQGIAQFTYVEGSIGFSGWKFGRMEPPQAGMRSFALNVSGVRRFVRPLGIGLELEVPFFQTNTSDFTGVPTENTFNSFFGWDAVEEEFQPEVAEYKLRKNAVPRILLRLYLGDGYDDFYFEGRFAISSVREEYTFRRGEIVLNDSTQVAASNVDYSGKIGYTAAGFAMGYQNTNDDGWFFRIRAGFDVMRFEESDMNFSIPFTYFSSQEDIGNVELVSPISETVTNWYIDIGTGYYF